MAIQGLATRFAPGVSGNPGGRPSIPATVRKLAGRKGWHALRIILDSLQDDADLVIIDARGLQRMAVEMMPDEPEGRSPAEEQHRALAVARLDRLQEWRVRFAALWVEADQLDEAGRVSKGFRNVNTGVWLSAWTWQSNCEVYARHQCGLEAIGAHHRSLSDEQLAAKLGISSFDEG